MTDPPWPTHPRICETSTLEAMSTLAGRRRHGIGETETKVIIGFVALYNRKRRFAMEYTLECFSYRQAPKDP